ncbi:aminotransferase class I/II-fold pyridoxal phosphate-dependent enzyme [Marinicella sp. W31]|uniref:aminotransferase class I/II-fold pyridoxal phosphate-dependent enzyme n=1 Tax=Marinicella sp. W31 TaxID=3023713 RepID=UPI003758079E
MNELKLDFNERADSIPDWLSHQQLDLSQLWLYPDRKPIESALAQDLNLETHNILLTNGGDESIELLFKLCKLQQQRMVVPEPCFSQYTHGQNIWQLEAEFIPAGPQLTIDQAAIVQQIKANDWLVLTRPNNPTGEYISDAALRSLLTAAQNNNTWVFLDEAYIEFANPNKAWHNWSEEFPNVVILRSFSKAFGLAGARLGYLVGQPELIEQFRRLAMPFNVSQLNLQIASLGLQNLTEVHDYCSRIENNRNQVYQYLQQLGVAVCESRANFLLMRLSPKSKTLLTRLCESRRIRIKTQMPGLEDYVRITLPDRIEKLMSVLKLAFEPQVLAFDMDGVLIDTSASYDQCISQTVELLTGHNVSLQDITVLRAAGGFNNDWDLTHQLMRNLGQDIELDQVVQTFQSLYHGEDGNTGLKLSETNLLTEQGRKYLFEQESAVRAVVTGRPRTEAQDGIAQLNIQPHYVVSADDVKQQKPDPEGLLSVLEKSGKNRMWFCGDTVDDMQAGTAAGCVCIGIGAEPQHLYAAGAHLVLENINQLEELI